MSRPVVYVALQQFCEADDRARRVLEDAGLAVRLNTLGHRLKREEMPEVLQGADAVLAGVEPYDAELLARLPQLRCISRCGVGTDAIDLEAAARRQVAVLTTPNETVEPVAQLTVAMILALARNLALHAADAREGRWKKRTGVLLSEWTVGVVGFGRIGQAVAQYLRPFGCRILAADPALAPERVPADVQFCDLRALLAQADVVSLHASRRGDDAPLIGAREFAAMKLGAMLVNTSRGTLVDEGALLESLRAGRLAGAALDVYGAEPYQGPLAALPQVICTPHIATLTRASRAEMEWRCAQNVVEYFAGAPVTA